MDSQFRSALISGAILAIGTLIVSSLVGFLTKYGDVHIFTIENNTKKFAIIMIEHWRGYDEKKFEILLPGTKFAYEQENSSVENFHSRQDGNNSTIISFKSPISDSRSVLIINVDMLFDESDAKLITHPFGYLFSTGNKLSFYTEIIKNSFMAVINGILFGSFVLWAGKKFEKYKIENDKVIRDLRDIENKYKEDKKSIRSSLQTLKLILLKRVREANAENEMWRMLIQKVLISSSENKVIINSIIRNMVSISGGSWTAEKNMNDINYSDVMDILEEIRRKKKN